MNAQSLPVLDGDVWQAGTARHVENSTTRKVEEERKLKEPNLKNKLNNSSAWWRQIGTGTPTQLVFMTKEGIGAEGIVWTIAVIIHNKQIDALIDSRAGRSCKVAPEMASELGLEKRILGKGLVFWGINGRSFKVWEYVIRVKWRVIDYKCYWDFLIVPIAYAVILGAGVYLT